MLKGKLKKKQRVLILDGSNNLMRAVSVAQSRPNLNSKAIFLRILASTIQKFRPNLCYIVFDGQGGNNIKRKVYPEYKSSRGAVSKIQTQDYLQIYDILKHTPIITIRVNNIEGDNVISHITLDQQKKGNSVVISSTDKDFYQLCSENVIVWNPITKTQITKENIIQLFKCHPVNFGIFKSIIGDASDDIPGIKGVGQKTLHRYFPNLFQNIDPLQGQFHNFQQYVNNMQHSDHKLKVRNQLNNLKKYFKVIDLRSGAFLTPQTGSIIQDIVEKKKRNLQFDKAEFINEIKKYRIKNDDLFIIYPALHMIHRK